jgi:hypothetical protein
VQTHPELVQKYLGSVVPQGDNFFAALNSAVFTDGSFVYIPKGVRCPMELSTYFRINAKSTGQFELTLIIAVLRRASAGQRPLLVLLLVLDLGNAVLLGIGRHHTGVDVRGRHGRRDRDRYQRPDHDARPDRRPCPPVHDWLW